jgi:hypothetical protein
VKVVSQFFFCHPEFISGSRNALILLGAETSLIFISPRFSMTFSTIFPIRDCYEKTYKYLK